MWERRENDELSKALKQMENQAKESDGAPQAISFFFRAREDVVKRVAWNVVKWAERRALLPRTGAQALEKMWMEKPSGRKKPAGCG
jgi:hypothetical protein